jgi:hypothetical protein
MVEWRSAVAARSTRSCSIRGQPHRVGVTTRKFVRRGEMLNADSLLGPPAGVNAQTPFNVPCGRQVAINFETEEMRLRRPAVRR